ncbi:hypothetical protein CT0861_05691 [Colletotrichum tofieldiae]|uniref:Uncharacterized protein n=1 Tax=Colletotrichum tofieldiae TaxID=708197 RepID=A0A166MP02_9PEZI|nr:hypothetical protein CT0861_05691 [Colletotrichum tofieldiae]
MTYVCDMVIRHERLGFSDSRIAVFCLAIQLKQTQSQQRCGCFCTYCLTETSFIASDTRSPFMSTLRLYFASTFGRKSLSEVFCFNDDLKIYPGMPAAFSSWLGV